MIKGTEDAMGGPTEELYSRIQRCWRWPGLESLTPSLLTSQSAIPVRHEVEERGSMGGAFVTARA